MLLDLRPSDVTPDRGNWADATLGEPSHDEAGALPRVRSRLFVYLSGPITPAHGYTADQNIAQATAVFLEAVRRGIPVFCPHFSGLVHDAWEIPHALWIAIDLAVIDRCTHVLALPRWETSPGAVIEVAHARRIGCPVVTSLDELP